MKIFRTGERAPFIERKRLHIFIFRIFPLTLQGTTSLNIDSLTLRMQLLVRLVHINSGRRSMMAENKVVFGYPHHLRS